MKKILFVFPPKEKASLQYYPRVRDEINILRNKYKIIMFDSPRANNKFVKLLDFVRSLANLVGKIKNSDMVIIYMSPIWYLVIPIAKVFRKKIVCEHFTTSIYNFELSNIQFKFVFKFFDSLIYNFFDLIITHTESMKNLLSRSYRMRWQKFLVMYYFVDTDYFRRLKRNVLLAKKIGLNQNKRVVIYHGLFHPFHGVNTILKAAKILSSSGIIFILIGRKLEKVPDNVISISPIRYDDLPDYFSLGDIWVGSLGIGTQGKRAFSSSMIAAMSCNLPVIVGDWNENKKVIINGFNGYIVKRNNHIILARTIQKLLKDKDLKLLGNNARNTIESSFSLKFMGQKLLKEIDNFI